MPLPAAPKVTLPGDAAIPIVGFGTYRLTGHAGYEAIRHALDVGYRHLDTASMYGNEAEVGRAVRDSGVPRDSIFITTKLWPDDADRAGPTLAASLDALGTDHLDLWLIHWPPQGQARPDVWRHLLDVRDEGLVRAVGVSNYAIAQLDELIAATGEAPAINQIEFGPARYDAALLAEHHARGITVAGWSPFRSSDLHDPVLLTIADHHRVTVPQVIIRWHVQHEVVVIPKSATPSRIAENLDVFTFSLTDDEMNRIDARQT